MPVKNREKTKMLRQVQIGDLWLDARRHSVSRGQTAIELPGLSFRLLEVLAERWPMTVSRRELVNAVWGDVVVSDDTLRQRVRLLRESLGGRGYVATVKGIGYRLGQPVRYARASIIPRRKIIAGALLLSLGLVSQVIYSNLSGGDLTHSIKHAVRH